MGEDDEVLDQQPVDLRLLPRRLEPRRRVVALEGRLGRAGGRPSGLALRRQRRPQTRRAEVGPGGGGSERAAGDRPGHDRVLGSRYLAVRYGPQRGRARVRGKEPDLASVRRRAREGPFHGCAEACQPPAIERPGRRGRSACETFSRRRGQGSRQERLPIVWGGKEKKSPAGLSVASPNHREQHHDGDNGILTTAAGKRQGENEQRVPRRGTRRRTGFEPSTPAWKGHRRDHPDARASRSSAVSSEVNTPPISAPGRASPRPRRTERTGRPGGAAVGAAGPGDPRPEVAGDDGVRKPPCETSAGTATATTTPLGDSRLAAYGRVVEWRACERRFAGIASFRESR